MRAVTVEPGVAGSARLDDVPEPVRGPHELLIDVLLVGVCGTDAEIVAGAYGEAPPGASRLVLGHESVGRIRAGPDGSPIPVGSLVVPMVRRPDPVPCPSCAVGEWDMCQNGRYAEHGIKALDGFGAERVAVDAETVVEVPERLGELGVLVEPTSVVAKAWEQIDRISERSRWRPRTVLVTGAGPIGLLAALLARQRGLELHVFDRVTDGPKPELVESLGGRYHSGTVAATGLAPDVVLECTGVGSVVLDALEITGRSGLVCLTGLSSGSRTIDLDATALNRRLVLENHLVFGTVSANRRHYVAAVAALAAADRDWLSRLITRIVELEDWPEAFAKRADDVKTAVRTAPEGPR